MIQRSALAAALALGLILGLFWALGSLGGAALAAAVPSATPGILYVAPGGQCGAAAPCYASVQPAVDAARAGDEIRVAQGTYTGVQTVPSLNSVTFTATQMLVITKTLTIRGGYATTDWNVSDPDTHPTTLDAGGQGRVIFITGNIQPLIEGLRITGGNATGLGGGSWGDIGGGVYIDFYVPTATISHCVIFSNTASSSPGIGAGGGLYLGPFSPRLIGNIIAGNQASTRGLGLGGGLYMDSSSAELIGNTIEGNTASTASAGVGGGLYIIRGAPVLRDNIVTGNAASTASEGNAGGLYLYNSRATLSGNTVRGNTAGGSTGSGGGLYVDEFSNATLTNNVIADNWAGSTGSGLHIRDASAILVHTTIARNSGGDGSAVYITKRYEVSNVTFTNTVIFSHTVGIAVTEGNSVSLDATLWHANTTDRAGAGMINHSHDHSGDPAFAADGYHLTAGSAAVDRGVDAGVTADIDGDARPQGPGYDLGADEFVVPLPANRIYLPLVRSG